MDLEEFHRQLAAAPLSFRRKLRDYLRHPTERNACYITGMSRRWRTRACSKTAGAAKYWLAVIGRTERMPDVGEKLIAEMDNPPAPLQAETKTLARYEPDTVYIGSGGYVAECVRADDGDYYLVADVDAEIQALRAEVEVWKASFEQAASGHATYAERTEQLLAERDALRAENDMLWAHQVAERLRQLKDKP